MRLSAQKAALHSFDSLWKGYPWPREPNPAFEEKAAASWVGKLNVVIVGIEPVPG